MEIKVVLCNCKGLCESFKEADMNTLPFAVESDLDVKYTVLHPQLCGQGGNAVLADALASSGKDVGHRRGMRPADAAVALQEAAPRGRIRRAAVCPRRHPRRRQRRHRAALEGGRRRHRQANCCSIVSMEPPG